MNGGFKHPVEIFKATGQQELGYFFLLQNRALQSSEALIPQHNGKNPELCEERLKAILKE